MSPSRLSFNCGGRWRLVLVLAAHNNSRQQDEQDGRQAEGGAVLHSDKGWITDKVFQAEIITPFAKTLGFVTLQMFYMHKKDLRPIKGKGKPESTVCLCL